MQIQTLFAKPIDRPIEGVIKADDRRFLISEVEEYVVTPEITHGLQQFVERYLEEPSANGVWISGFFGSGKSHLLKMLSIVLENQTLPDGRRAPDVFLPRIEDEIVRANLQRAIRIPSKSVLFNIDQKSTAIGGDTRAPVLEAFVKVFNEMQDYFAAQPHIAQFERDLDRRGSLETFKAVYERTSGHRWEEHLPYIETLENETFANAYAAHSGVSREEALRLFDRLRESYKVSVESFARDVKAYLDRQPAGFRVNFFVDEAGQFIGQDTLRMLNLQTIAETLSTVCAGRAWVIVTSQGDLQRVIGDLNASAGNDFTKIEARFKTRLNMTSTNVRDVIQRRLLAKKEAEPEPLAALFEREKDNLQTLYRFGDGTPEFRRWRGRDEFCDLYPFVPYQFDLFQRAMERLSQHNNFTGRFTSVGERSTLSVFQEVAKQLRDKHVGAMAAFDQVYDGIAPMLRPDFQTAIHQSKEHLRDPLAHRILKALYLLKWFHEFKPTVRNVAILLIDRVDVDIKAHEQAVAQALSTLESQSYLQRNGDVYEFLTNLEKDIEVEIRNTDVDRGQVSALLSDILFADLLRDPKIHYAANDQDYPYARRLDDALMGRDQEVGVNLITQAHEQYGQPQALAARSMGRAELVAVLPEDRRLLEDCELHVKTRKYVQQTIRAGLGEEHRAIIDQRGRQNDARRNALIERCRPLLERASLHLNGSALVIRETDPRQRFSRAGQDLIAFAYPKLTMLRGSLDPEAFRRILLEPDDLLGPLPLGESENEVLTFVTRNQADGLRTRVDNIVREFGKRPYGWPPQAALAQLAKLMRAGKIELRETGLLDARAAADALGNNRRHAGIQVRLLSPADPAKVAALKRFYQDFFDRPNPGADPRAAIRETALALNAEADRLEALSREASRYPFLAGLVQPVIELRSLAGREDAGLLDGITSDGDRLLHLRDEQLRPIDAFMSGQQRSTYDAVLAFWRELEAIGAAVDGADAEAIRQLALSATPYRGAAVPQAKTAMERLKARLAEALAGERARALDEIERREHDIRSMLEYAGFDPARQAAALEMSARAKADLTAARNLPALRERAGRYLNTDYNTQLATIYQLARQATGADAKAPAIRVIPASALETGLDLVTIADEVDLDRWLAALRAAALAELRQGNRISL